MGAENNPVRYEGNQAYFNFYDSIQGNHGLLKTPEAVVCADVIRKVVASHYFINVKDLNKSSRKGRYIVPRQLAMYLCRELMPTWSLPDIGEVFDRTHTDVLHGIRATKNRLEIGELSEGLVNILTRQIGEDMGTVKRRKRKSLF
jgi:chromosomal replication initiation ATPase DnaA